MTIGIFALAGAAAIAQNLSYLRRRAFTASMCHLGRLGDDVKQIISTAVAAVLFFATTQPSRAESPSSAVHRPVNASDLMGGYIPEGTRAEVEGFIGAQDGVVMFKYHPLSAQYPVTIVTSSLSRDLLERVAARCAWDGTSAGMCEGTVRGTVMSKASRSLLADDIIIK